MASDINAMRKYVGEGIPKKLPNYPEISKDVDHAPARRQVLSKKEKKIALRNALRYFSPELHKTLASEFAEELETFGRIWMMRFRPTEYEIKAYSIDTYPAKSKQAASIMLMIHNNLDKDIGHQKCVA